MSNTQIADIFDEIADLLEFTGANPFRVRAYRNGARTIRDLPDSVAAILDDDNRELTDFAGIGKDLAEKCAVLVATGELEMLDELREEVPASVLTMIKIPGVGPKKAAALHKELGISTLEELRAACQDQRVRELKGFGAKTEEAILKGIDLAARADDRILWAKADDVAQALLAHMRQCAAVEQIEVAGSYRRGKETVGDLDLLVVADDVAAVMDRFGEFDGADEVIARGETKMAIRLSTGLQIDLRVAPAGSFGAALQYFTGSKEHNVVLRGRARQRGLKINEWGVFRVQKGDDDATDASGPDSPHYVAGRTEQDVYATLDLPVFPPELREARREFDWADAGELPKLIEVEDLRGDLHMHTTATDGKATLEEMVAAARELGHEYIAITDHSQRVSMARGLDPERLLAQWREIDELNDRLEGEIVVLKGIECDILEQGGMDLPDDVLAQADWVIASVHYGQRQSRQQITQRVLGAIENPHVAIIAHPTGRLLGRREPYEIDLDQVMAAAAEHGKLLELNSNPLRLDLNDTHCAAAKERGVPIVISTDAHSTEQLNLLRYGVKQARRAGLGAADVANTRAWKQLKEMVGKRG